MGCCLGNEREAERRPLVDRLSLAKFRDGRDEHRFRGHPSCVKCALKAISITLGVWEPSGWAILLSITMAAICAFQLAYDLFVVCGCPGFDCGFVEKQDSAGPHKRKPFRKTANTMYTLASLGGFFSYTLLLVCLLLIRRRRYMYNYKAVRPVDVLNADLSDTQLQVLTATLALTVSLFLASVGLFYYIIHTQPSGTYFDWLAVGVGSQFLAQWAAIIASHHFQICCFALGSLANDTVRRIKDMKLSEQRREDETMERQREEPEVKSEGEPGVQHPSRSSVTVTVHREEAPIAPEIVTEHKDDTAESSVSGGAAETSVVQPGRAHISGSAAVQPEGTTSSHSEEIIAEDPPKGVPISSEHVPTTTEDFPNVLSAKNRGLDLAIEYHEELCLIVSDTVSAFCPWFVVHWLLYGSTSLLAIVELSEEIGFSTAVVDLVYIGCFATTHVILFLLPCCCAAYITDACGGIHARINKTTSSAWSPGHPFRERTQVMMFTSYAKDRQCVFKIGRVTFTSTLAWVSLLFGSTGLLFHFF